MQTYVKVCLKITYLIFQNILKNMHKYAFESKSLKVKYVFVGTLSVLTLKYDFMKYHKYSFEKHDVFENTSTFL